MKKNVYLIQASCLYGNTYYLPYATGMLIAYAKQDTDVSDEYDFKRIIYKFEDIDESIASLEAPYFVGFSNSLWNYSYNLLYAEKLKAAYPDCKILFGGHHIPPSTEYLDKYPFIDYLIYRKGEEAFKSLLLALCNKTKELFDIPNIAFREDEKTYKTENMLPVGVDYPSPYLTGVFDEIIKDKKYPFSCVLETNRGCPFDCCYCDWGELNSEVRLFPLEKVYDELKWMSENKISFVYCVDANFGLFERDREIADEIIRLKETTGYPNRLQVSYSKTMHDRVFDISCALTKHGIGKGATLSLQTLSPDVLKIIGRCNMSKELYKKQIDRYWRAGIPTYTELIIGLPGETLESFCKGLCETLELGQHSSLSAYYCELLPNSRMADKAFIDKYGIKTVSSSLIQYHCSKMEDNLPGYSNIVTGSNTMSVADWMEANLFSTCVQAFHHLGFFQFVSIFCHYERNVSYFSFYMSLYNYIRQETTFLREVFREAEKLLVDFTEGKGGLTCYDERFGDITFPIEEMVFLKCIYNKETVFKEIKPFVSQYVEEQQLLNGLFRYQSAVLLDPDKNLFSEKFDYDFKAYFDAVLSGARTTIEKKPVKYCFESAFDVRSWSDYAREIIWYGRRNCRMLLTNKPNKIDVINL